MKLVLDTSVIVKIFLEEEGTERAAALMEKIDSGEHVALIPSLAIYDVLGVLIREISDPEEYDRHLSVFFGLIDEGLFQVVEGNAALMGKATTIARTDTKSQGHVSLNDATFHALAFMNDAVFITADIKHHRKTTDAVGSVMLLDGVEFNHGS